MRSESERGAAVAVIVLAGLFFLLAVGGGLFYIARNRQQALAAQLEAELKQRERKTEASFAAYRQPAPSLASKKSPSWPDVEASADQVRAAVEEVLKTQEKAWNDGDLDAFMAHYWKSDALTFSSGGKTTRGWQATMDRYRERYATRALMGKLTLSNFETTPLGDSAALVLGKWAVERDSNPLAGNFSIVLRRIDGRWVVIHDHTSRSAE